MPDNASATSEPKRKAWWRHWLARGYVLVGVLWIFGPAFIDTDRFAAYWVVWAVFFFAPGGWMLVSLTAFPLKYGVFGPLRRTPLPKGSSSWFNEVAAGIGMFRVRGLERWFGRKTGISGFAWTSWRVYANGLGVTVTFFGSAFVHRDQLLSLREARGGRWILEHASPEVANPITLYDERLVKAVQAITPDAASVRAG